MIEGPFEKFCDELESLVEKWGDKPLDDGLTHGEVVGALEFVKMKVMAMAGGLDYDDD